MHTKRKITPLLNIPPPPSRKPTSNDDQLHIYYFSGTSLSRLHGFGRVVDDSPGLLTTLLPPSSHPFLTGILLEQLANILLLSACLGINLCVHKSPPPLDLLGIPARDRETQ